MCKDTGKAELDLWAMHFTLLGVKQPMESDSDRAREEAIRSAWRHNAEPWTNAVRTRRIASREAVTNQAIVDAVAGLAPRTVVDIGCGEGWLARELAARHIDVLGIDAEPALIERAREAGGGHFRVASYADIAGGAMRTRADAAVCNFSLLGAGSVDALIAAVPALLNPGGALVIQTLHPRETYSDLPYRDGWREGSWVGFGPEFDKPAPWYFRTVENWVGLLERSGFRQIDQREPRHPETGRPASIIFIARE